MLTEKNKKGFFCLKKGQTEIIGLVIIVIMVVLAFLIFLVAKLANPSENVKSAFMNEEIANNFLIALGRANAENCPKMQLADLITDCAKDYPELYCAGVPSCEAVREAVNISLNRTLVSWGVSFNFSISNTDVSFINRDCGSKGERVAKSLILSKDSFSSDKVVVSLVVCLR